MSQLSTEQHVSCYKLERTIDRGGFGIVHQASHMVTGQKVAVKVLKKDLQNPESLPLLYREAQIMQKLKHPNIVQLFEMIESTTEIFLIMEYVPLGNLHYYIIKHGRMQELQARSVFRQLVSAVHYCHQRGVVHRDLKMENVLFDSQMNIKLTDFGLSDEFTPGTLLETFCGSPNYIAPEIVREIPYDGPAADVWALGVILYALVTRELPFLGLTVLHLRHVVMAARYSIPEYMSAHCQLLLGKILIPNPTMRASLTSIMQDRWINTGYEGDELKPYTEPLPDQDPTPERTNAGYEDGELKPAIEPLPDVEDPTPERMDAGYEDGELKPAIEPLPDVEDPTPERMDAGYEDGELKPAIEPLPDVEDPTPERMDVGYEDGELKPAIEPLPDVEDPTPERMDVGYEVVELNPAIEPVPDPEDPIADLEHIVEAVIVVAAVALWFYLLS